jgi:hypothetical protein
MRTSSVSLLLAIAASIAGAAVFGVATAHAEWRSIPVSGTGGPQTGPFTPWDGSAGPEFPGGEADGGPSAFGGAIADRSLSRGSGKPVSVGNGKGRSKSNPTLGASFDGLNIYDQRYARGGNQFTVEPPDQGLCAGNGYVVEMVNDVMNVYNTSGASLLPDNTGTNIVSGFPRDVQHAVDLNSFYGYAPALDRAHGNVRGEFVTDPSCLYDAQTNRWFAVVLTLDPQVSGPCQGVFSCVNHLDIAVSTSGDPTVLPWNIYRIPVTNDGGNSGGVNPCPCLGDYPHLGADANGFYVTTNSYPWHENGFDGAQIYAFSKTQLAAGAFSVTMQHIDTSGMVNAANQEGAATQPGFTVWPAQSPAGQFSSDNGGTEYFLSSNAADEAQEPVSGGAGPLTSDQLVLWTLTNTSSLNSASPAAHLTSKVIDNVDPYAVPPKQQQPGAGTAPGVNAPQGHCLNDTTTQLNPVLFGPNVFGCWKLLVGAPFSEVVSTPDSNDTRMQQVTYANGQLWGALDTAVSVGGGSRAGIAYYVLNPSAGKVTLQGYVADAAFDYTYPAIGVLQNGRGVMAFTVTGDNAFPSSGYTSMDAKDGAGDVHIAAAGVAPADGFTGYRSQSSPPGSAVRTRWGDYSATAIDGNSIWIASEYIGGKCDYTDWGGPFFLNGTGDNLLGSCGGASHGHGVRTAIANWSTRISQLTP